MARSRRISLSRLWAERVLSQPGTNPAEKAMTATTNTIVSRVPTELDGLGAGGVGVTGASSGTSRNVQCLLANVERFESTAAIRSAFQPPANRRLSPADGGGSFRAHGFGVHQNERGRQRLCVDR